LAPSVERIRQIDAEIERLRDAPEGGGPAPRNAPVGAPETRVPTNAELTDYLNKQKAQIQKDHFEQVNQEAKRETDPAKQRALIEAARNELYGNAYEGKDEAEMHAFREQQGRVDPEQSADYMEAQRGKTRSGPAPASAEQPKAEAQPEKHDYPSPSYLASQSLNYTRMTEKTDNAPDKAAEPVKPLDKSEPDKPLSPSELASLSLNYTLITSRTDSPDSPETKQEPTQGKESPDEPDLNP